MKKILTMMLAAAIVVPSTAAYAVHKYSPSDGYAYKVKRLGVVISEDMLPGKDGAVFQYQKCFHFFTCLPFLFLAVSLRVSYFSPNCKKCITRYFIFQPFFLYFLQF